MKRLLLVVMFCLFSSNVVGAQSAWLSREDMDWKDLYPTYYGRAYCCWIFLSAPVWKDPTCPECMWIWAFVVAPHNCLVFTYECLPDTINPRK